MSLSHPRPPSPVRSVQPIKLPIGGSDFATLVEGGYTFVDKSLLIEDFLQGGAQFTLLTRPRRFGKTLNLSMLQHFFAAWVNERPTQGLFAGLKIAASADAMAHQGRYPVVFLSLKDVKADSFAEFEADLRGLLSELYEQYPELADSDKLSPTQRRQVQAILNQDATPADTRRSLKRLCEFLYRHHGQKVILLLDEYDTPIHSAFVRGFYSEVIGFMRKLLGAALKDNPYLFKAFVTGVLRIAKESLFSDLNNPDVLTVLDERLSAHFGFTEAEVSALLEATNLAVGTPVLGKAIKDWYNGYRIGGQTIYNPWSIVNCLNRGGKLEPYWVNTSGDDILKRAMARADGGFKEGLEQVIHGGTTNAIVDPKVAFADLDGNSTALWSLLLFSGYLTAERLGFDADGNERCTLRIPNAEIAGLYNRYIREWFTGTMNAAGYETFLRSLASGDVAQFETILRDYLLHSASFFDGTGHEPEKFYHGLVLGMIVGLRESHDIRSNRESGTGRYDVLIVPKAGSRYDLAVILEFKRVREPARLEAAAHEALEQIEARSYAAELEQSGTGRVLAMGLAFAGKELALRQRMESI